MRRISITFVTLVAAGALLSCNTGGSEAGADQSATVAFLRAVPAEDVTPLLDELRRAGYVPGDGLRILPEDHLGEVHPDPDDARLAVERWLRRGADLVFAFSSSGAAAAAEVAGGVPVLFLVNDPSAVGLVDDEETPSGGLTGVTFRVPADRTLDLARRAIPGLVRVGLLYPTEDPAAAPHRAAVERAGGAMAVEVVSEGFAGPGDVDRALDVLVAAGVGAVVIANAPTMVRALDAVEPAVAERGLPLIANVSLDFAPTAVVAISPDVAELQAQLGRQAVRILAGTDPSDVPVEDPRRFTVSINAARAAELGLPPLPRGLLRQADEVVE